MRKMTRARNNNNCLAVGLEYSGKNSNAPTIALNETQLCAEQVLKIARRFGIPIVEKPALAQALRTVPLGTEIPERLFEAVAVVLNEIERSSSAAKSRR